MTFAETFVEKDRYWHACDEHRSVSLTSMVITEDGRPVPADAIARQLSPVLDGTPVYDLPRGLIGRAVTMDLRQPARASRALSGMVAASGRLLVVTITSDDLAWARQTWLSIRGHRAD